jgi:hypothetical protein
MLSSRSELADDICPVPDELLGELHRANDLFVPGFVSTLAPDIRALLALFCYRRSHLHSMGLGIAASCDKENLVWAGGSVGAFLFASSRDCLHIWLCHPVAAGGRSRSRQASSECLQMKTNWS